jgi:transcription initiation factor IIE alpha subunit
MRATSVPQALRERLGHDGTIGLMEFVDAEHAEWSERLMNIFIERFERRLAEQIGELRSALVREIHETRSQTIQWTFLFWATQLTAFVGLLVFIFRNGAR